MSKKKSLARRMFPKKKQEANGDQDDLRKVKKEVTTVNRRSPGWSGTHVTNEQLELFS